MTVSMRHFFDAVSISFEDLLEFGDCERVLLFLLVPESLQNEEIPGDFGNLHQLRHGPFGERGDPGVVSKPRELLRGSQLDATARLSRVLDDSPSSEYAHARL